MTKTMFVGAHRSIWMFITADRVEYLPFKNSEYWQVERHARANSVLYFAEVCHYDGNTGALLEYVEMIDNRRK